MVAKLIMSTPFLHIRLNLAKIHMVAKLCLEFVHTLFSLNLAKIHMVAKLWTAMPFL